MADRDYDRERGYGDRDRASDYDRNRDFDRNSTDRARHADERGPVARGADEVRSWFGDDEARRRRELDEQRDRDRPGDWGHRARAWSGSPDRSRGDEYRERGYGASREWGGESRPEPGWSVRDRYLQSGSLAPRGGDVGRRDYSNRDYGNVEYTSREYGRRDTGGRDDGYGGRSAEPSNWTVSDYGAAGATSGGYAREDWGPRAGSSARGEARSFAGRGPRNYRRSDDRVREDVNERLTNDPRIDATDIEVEVAGGEVTLRGHVDDRRTRRLAEECIEDVPGVRDVKNELKAERRDREDGSVGHQGNPLQRDDRTSLNLSDAERQQPKK